MGRQPESVFPRRPGKPRPEIAVAEGKGGKELAQAKLNSAGDALVLGTYLNVGDAAGAAVRGLSVSETGEVAVTAMVGVRVPGRRAKGIAGARVVRDLQTPCRGSWPSLQTVSRGAKPGRHVVRARMKC